MEIAKKPSYDFASFQKTCLEAEAKGLVVFSPEKDELFLNWDKPVEGEDFNRMRRHLQDVWGIHFLKILITVSKGGGNHVYIKTDSDVSLNRIYYQLALFSDPVREMMSLRRKDFWAEETSLLFEIAEEAKRVQSWRVSTEEESES